MLPSNSEKLSDLHLANATFFSWLISLGQASIQEGVWRLFLRSSAQIYGNIPQNLYELLNTQKFGNIHFLNPMREKGASLPRRFVPVEKFHTVV